MYTCESNYAVVLNEISSVEFSGLPLVPSDSFDSVTCPLPDIGRNSPFNYLCELLFYICTMIVIYNRTKFWQILYNFWHYMIAYNKQVYEMVGAAK